MDVHDAPENPLSTFTQSSPQYPGWFLAWLLPLANAGVPTITTITIVSKVMITLLMLMVIMYSLVYCTVLYSA